MDPNPYATPRSALEPGAPRVALPMNPAGYQSARPLGRAVLITSGLVLACNWLFAIMGMLSSLTPPVWAKVGMVVAIAAMLLFFIWPYRAAQNAFALGRPLSFNPAMCVIWFFVPVANVVMPARVVGQLESASHAESRGIGKIALAYAWWLTYVLNILCGSLLNSAMRKNDVDSANVMRVVGTAIITICFALLVVVVRRSSDGQDEASRAPSS